MLSVRKLLGIKWYHYVQIDDVRRTTKQPYTLAIVQPESLKPDSVSLRRVYGEIIALHKLMAICWRHANIFSLWILWASFYLVF